MPPSLDTQVEGEGEGEEGRGRRRRRRRRRRGGGGGGSCLMDDIRGGGGEAMNMLHLEGRRYLMKGMRRRQRQHLTTANRTAAPTERPCPNSNLLREFDA